MVTRTSSLLKACALTLALFQLMCSSESAAPAGAEPGAGASAASAGSSPATGGAAAQGGTSSATAGAGNGSSAGAPVACPAGVVCTPVLPGDIVPLYGPSTMLEPEVHFDRGDAIV